MEAKTVVICKGHFDLPTYQKRLRHIKGIACRNLLFFDNSPAELKETQLCFTLHLPNCKAAFYRSSAIPTSCNPTWRSFDTSHMNSKLVDLASNNVTIKIWQTGAAGKVLLLQWDVNLTGLEYVSSKVLPDNLPYPANTVVIKIFDAFFTAPVHENLIPRDPSRSIMKADLSAVRTSYSVNSIQRMRTVARAIAQTQDSVVELRQAIQEKLQKTKHIDDLRCAHETAKLRVANLRVDMQRRLTELQATKEEYNALHSGNHLKALEVQKKREDLQNDKARLQEKRKGYLNTREQLIRTGNHLVLRRKQLIHDLTFIYPINEIAEGKSSKHVICGVHLPNSENFAGTDDVSIMVALGYVCHLVQQICKFLDVPPRYPMEYYGSRSSIRDHIHDKLSDKERDFPLFSRGRERVQFNYGVYLLNRNISQLRYYCGMGTLDLSATLPNLKKMLELKLGGKQNTITIGTSNYTPIAPKVSVQKQQTMQKSGQIANGQKIHSASSENLCLSPDSHTLTNASSSTNKATSSSSAADLLSYDQPLYSDPAAEKENLKAYSSADSLLSNDSERPNAVIRTIQKEMDNKSDCDSNQSNGTDDNVSFTEIYESKFKHWGKGGGKADGLHMDRGGNHTGSDFSESAALHDDDNTFKTSAMKQHRRTKSDHLNEDMLNDASACHRSQSSHAMSVAVGGGAVAKTK